MSSCGRSKEILNVTIVSSLQQSLMKSTEMSSDLISSKIISSNSVSTKTVYFCYRPQRSCEGYVFTGVCLSTGGGVSTSVHAGIPLPRSRHPSPRADTPLSRHPPKFFFFSFLLFFAFFTPPPPRYRRRPLLRTVRILLECILVFLSNCTVRR